ncbi:hypothetical protein AX17_003819 [Amanita inopinata Kibby_2008]|nr:hypothetical protein AX17_003819 [Amanita inopinata Kibby_2008]
MSNSALRGRLILAKSSLYRNYELVVRQEPKQARMCGIGGKADRRPIDPPPIVQLRVIDPNAPSSPRRRRTSTSGSAPGSPIPSRPDPSNPRDAVSYAQSYLQNPYYFMFASLAKPDDDAELHWLKDGRTRCTTGSVVSSLYHLKDPQHNNEDAGFFVFPDLSVRTEGSYRLKLSLFEVVGNNVRHCKSIYSAPFYVYTAKKFPGMEESTPLSCSLADQGIKIRIRKDIRVRKRPIQALEPLSHSTDGPSNDNDDDERDGGHSGKRSSSKRSRTEENVEASDEANNSDVHTLTTSQQSQPWPPVASIDPSLAPTIPPPPNAQTAASTVSNETSSSMVNSVAPLNGPVYDGRGGYQAYETQLQPQQIVAQPSHQVTTQAQYRPDPSQQHQPPGQQQIPPSSSQQQYATPHHPPPPTQHVHPQSHIPPPPPPPGHVMHHAILPPVQQAYAPYPSQGWGAPPPAQPQQQMYDPYSHYHQHPPPPHPHYAPIPPPVPPAMHMQHPPPHVPPPARYDYPSTMYAQPPPAPHLYSGYYEQQPPPHPHQTQHPQQYAPAPVGTGTSSPNNSMPPPVAPPTTGYVDYNVGPYARATSSPQPRPYHPHTHPQAHYGSYPPPHPPHHQPRHYGPPPPHPYGYPYAPPPPAEQWGTPAPPTTAWGDAYGAQATQPVTAGPPNQVPASSSTNIVAPPMPSSGLVGAVGNPGDRIQLAPLRASTHTAGAAPTNAPGSSPALSHGMPTTSSAAAGSRSGQSNHSGPAYPVIQLTGRNRTGYDTTRDDRDDRGERDPERLGGRAGKKNPLSIGSIISNE